MASLQARGQRTATRAIGRRAAVVVSLLLAGQLASVTHLLLVPHSVCPLDGELIHSDASSAHQHAAPQSRLVRLPAVAAVEMPEAHHGHDHCVLASNRRGPLSFREGAKGLLAPPQLSIAAKLSDVAAPMVGGALHRLAPKQSPPA